MVVVVVKMTAAMLDRKSRMLRPGRGRRRNVRQRLGRELMIADRVQRVGRRVDRGGGARGHRGQTGRNGRGARVACCVSSRDHWRFTHGIGEILPQLGLDRSERRKLRVQVFVVPELGHVHHPGTLLVAT